MSQPKIPLHKDLRPLVAKATAAGWTLVMGGSGHPRLLPPDGGPGITMSFSPRNARNSVRNLRRDLKRRGVSC